MERKEIIPARLNCLLAAFSSGRDIHMKEYLLSTNLVNVSKSVLLSEDLIRQVPSKGHTQLYRWIGPATGCPQRVIDEILTRYKELKARYEDNRMQRKKRNTTSSELPFKGGADSKSPLSQYTPRELLRELKARGYIWKEMFLIRKDEIKYENL